MELKKDLSTDYLLDNSIHSTITSKYKIIGGGIGKGSYGEVLMDIDKSGKQFAIKLMKKKKILKGQLLANELRIGTKMHHQNILV